MDTFTTEQALRREAVRRRLQGEPQLEICRALSRSPRWFDKWWAEYGRDPHTDFADRSRAPHCVPAKTPLPVEEAIVSVREALEAATTPETKYGLIGVSSVQRSVGTAWHRARAQCSDDPKDHGATRSDAS